MWKRSYCKYLFGNDKWNLEHKLPCSLFNLTLESHQKACFNYTNTCPLWHIENNSKQDKLNDGRLARNLTRNEKDEYLKSNGFSFLFE